MECFRPILPSPRYLSAMTIKADAAGVPIIDNPLFLLDSRLPEDEIKSRYPNLWSYLQEGVARGVHEGYICRHRSPWYKQEKRPAAPFVCTYIGRNDNNGKNPFRFILNNSEATVANSYLALYPEPALKNALERNPRLASKVWEILNEISPEAMIEEGRVYGGGMYKMEPRELAKVPVQEIAALIRQAEKPAPKIKQDTDEERVQAAGAI